MRIRLRLILIFEFFGLIAESRDIRRRAFQIPIQSSLFTLENALGRFQDLQLDTNIAETLVVDVECGRHLSRCARYCGDVTLASIFCPLGCQNFTPQTLVNICGERHRFNSTVSDTTEPIAGEWRRQFPGSRPLSGRRFTENLKYEATKLKRYYRYTYYFWLRIQFVSALYFDRRLLVFSSGIFGLGSGADSTLEILFQTEGIRYRKASLSPSANPQSIRIQKPAIHAFMFTVGGFDGYRCAEWRLLPSISPSGWVVEATEMDLLGRVFRQKFMIKFSTITDFVLMPMEVAEELLAAGKIVYFRDYGHQIQYAMPGECRDEASWIRIRLGDLKLDIQLSVAHGRRDDCILELGIDRMDPHLQRPVLTVGTMIFQDRCLGFDYERKAVGFARRRNRPAYPLLPEKLTNR